VAKMMRLKIEMPYKCGFLRYEVSKSGKSEKTQKKKQRELIKEKKKHLEKKLKTDI